MIVKVSYQTLLLPPPFAFAYTMELKFKNDQIDIQYDLEFLNRDEISMEEIEAEGYSENDDFSWKGSLGKVWYDDLYNDIDQIELEDETEEINVYLHMDISNDGHQDEGLVVLAEDWDYRLQELIQAIYEKAEIEAPLQLTCLNIEKGQKEKFELKGTFEHKTATINGKPIDWEEMHELVADIYNIEMEVEPTTKTNKDGLWVDPDSSGEYFNFDDLAGPQAAQIKKRILKTLADYK